VLAQLKEYHEEKDHHRHEDHHPHTPSYKHRYEKKEETIENLHIVHADKRRKVEVDHLNVHAALSLLNVAHLQEVLAIAKYNVTHASNKSSQNSKSKQSNVKLNV